MEFALAALRARLLRAGLTALGIAVGVAAVVLLTSIGEGVRRFVLSEFSQFGANLVVVSPGRTTTRGLPGAILGTVRPLTIDDAEELRTAPHVIGVVPGLNGNAAAKAGGRSRRTTVIGSGPDLPQVFRFEMAQGGFLPRDNPRSPRALAVLGARLKRELFGDGAALGERLQVGGNRFRVIGVMAPKGEFLGFDLDDAVYIPAARGLELFNREGLMEIDVAYTPGAPVDDVVASIRRRMSARHGREDFTVITQQQMLDVLGSILSVLTFAVGALGGISLVVGGVGILTIMTIAVAERTAEIGLLRALGAPRRRILGQFLTEAAALAGIGGAAGLLAGAGGAWLLGAAIPALPVHTPWSFALLAETVAVAIGLAAGVLPARRAALVNPVDALRSE